MLQRAVIPRAAHQQNMINLCAASDVSASSRTAQSRPVGTRSVVRSARRENRKGLVEKANHSAAHR
jgi:hypothetical protein